MSHHVAVCGVATPTGLYARCGDGWRKLEPTRTPIVQLEVTSEPVQEKVKPLFTWSDETIGGEWTATGRLHARWQQSEEDWIRTGC